MNRTVRVCFADDRRVRWQACYGNGEVTLNVGRLGRRWFDRPPAITWEIESLLIHELGHQRGDHLTEDYYEALCEIGARLSCLKLIQPGTFKEFM